MTSDEIIRIAKAVGLGEVDEDGDIWCSDGFYTEAIDSFAQLVAAAERKACADLLDKGVDLSGLAGSPSMQLFCATLLKGFADSIRERGAP